jgi:small subunit ribosomal protein S9
MNLISELEDFSLSNSPGEGENNSSRSFVPTKKDCKGRLQSTGKRKTSVAKLWLKVGTGSFKVNDLDCSDYFSSLGSDKRILSPISILGVANSYDVFCYVSGGGISSQCDAVVHALSKAFAGISQDYRSQLKVHGFLTRDDRIVERKKPGRPKARKKFQFSKR